jgi:hypothetical protein
MADDRRIWSVTITTNDPEQDPLELMKRAYPEAVELAAVLRRYLIDADGRWNGHKLWMAVDIAQGLFDAHRKTGEKR